LKTISRPRILKFIFGNISQFHYFSKHAEVQVLILCEQKLLADVARQLFYKYDDSVNALQESSFLLNNLSELFSANRFHYTATLSTQHFTGSTSKCNTYKNLKRQSALQQIAFSVNLGAVYENTQTHTQLSLTINLFNPQKLVNFQLMYSSEFLFNLTINKLLLVTFSTNIHNLHTLQSSYFSPSHK
jgi:hypothetical protein